MNKTSTRRTIAEEVARFTGKSVEETDLEIDTLATLGNDFRPFL
jgi:hypothetical protein